MFEMFALKSFKWISNIINFTKEITFMYKAWYKHLAKKKKIEHTIGEWTPEKAIIYTTGYNTVHTHRVNWTLMVLKYRDRKPKT